MPALYNINSLRYFATFLLVSYHVIGVDEQGGMHIGYPSAWRFFSDSLIDVRMPLFAFIAGVVYALKPLTMADASGFFIGKFRRIVVPGIVASVTFWLGCNLILKSGFAYRADPVATVLLSTGHFWFLQALLLIFITISVLDAVFKYKAALYFFLGALTLTLTWKYLSVNNTGYLEINSAVYLSPYFILGLVLFRYHEAVMLQKTAIILLSTCLVLLAVALNISVYQKTGQLSIDRFDFQSLSLGIGVILLAHFMFPKVDLLDRLAIYSFTIYLYHPFGTSAVRQVVEALGIKAPAVHFFIGVTTGLVLPCLMHIVAERFYWTRRILLGLRPRNSSPPTAIRRVL